MSMGEAGSIQVEGDRGRLQSFHEQSISVMNAMMSREWDGNDEDDDEAEGQGSMMGAIFILMNAIMGASILILPCSFGQIGIVTAVIMELFVVFIGYISHMVLADAVDKYNGSNYQDLVGRMCGPTVQLLSQFGLILYFFTLSCATHITMGDQAVKICELADGVDPDTEVEHSWYCKRDFLIPVGSMTLIFPLIWVRNISSFGYVSVFSVFAVFYIVAAIIIDYYKLALDVPEEIWMPDIGILPIMQYLPVFTLGFQCHMTSVPLYYELHQRSVAKYTVVILVTSCLVFVSYMLAGVFGLMTFGSKVNPDVLLDYSSKDGLMTIARGAISVSVIGSYPIFVFLGRGAIDDTIVQIAEKFSVQLERNSEKRRVITLLLWHGLALAIACVTSSFGIVLSFVGSIAALFMLFFPGYMLWIESRSGNWGYKVTGSILMFLGGFTFVWTIVFNVYQIAAGQS
ncbi:sodium-coupled neutral amino acid transporter 7-like [Bolinopsis microptera]|uniref:sodium-coupled neutral amino acid transporter 7-like n=1 Tax=Bolinopsis microptera TaxID=2820187 RepID=UPI003079C14D